MPRYIDADMLKTHIMDIPTWWGDRGGIYPQSEKYPEGLYFPEDIISSIDVAETADVVEVVRCKDCKYYIESTAEYVLGYCDRWCRKVRKRFYCEDGEKKTVEDEKR